MPQNEDKPLWPERRRRLLPMYLLAGVVVVWLAVQLSPLTRDYKVVATEAACVVTAVGLAVWFLRSGGRRTRGRWKVVALAAAALVGALLAIRLQTDGDGRIVGWSFRWTPRPDQQLALPVVSEAPVTSGDAQAEYPAFLGGGPWAEVIGVRLHDDWDANPPKELWRQPVGAGWSSFAVAGGLAVTQEQRDEQELVVAYHLEDGATAWWHGDDARFDPFGPTQRMGGVGPRATPTIHEGRVITHGATGIVNCLSLDSGDVVWSHDTHEEFGVTNLMWGKSGSPLVIADQNVVVIPVGDDDQNPARGHSLVAFDLDTGEVRWTGGGRVPAYATPVLTNLAGRRQILQVNQYFLTSHDAETGDVLWELPWPGSSNTNASCSQPVPISESRVFLSKGYSVGSLLLAVAVGADGQLSAEPVWKKNVMKTKFGNVVFRGGYAYGLDGVLLQCIDVSTGRGVWKERRRPSFGHGQILLVGDYLLILSEWGEVVLADASPDGYRERASLQALDPDEPTWNNPALAAQYLLVRNAREAVCYRMPLAD